MTDRHEDRTPLPQERRRAISTKVISGLDQKLAFLRAALSLMTDDERAEFLKYVRGCAAAESSPVFFAGLRAEIDGLTDESAPIPILSPAVVRDALDAWERGDDYIPTV